MPLIQLFQFLNFPVCWLCFFSENTKMLSQTFKQTKWLEQRERSFCSFWWNYIFLSQSSPMFRIIITCDSKHRIGYVGFRRFLAGIKLFWKCWTYDTIKKTCIMWHKAVESFGWMFLDSFDALECLFPWAASEREHIYHGGMQERKKNPYFKASKGE